MAYPEFTHQDVTPWLEEEAHKHHTATPV